MSFNWQTQGLLETFNFSIKMPSTLELIGNPGSNVRHSIRRGIWRKENILRASGHNLLEKVCQAGHIHVGIRALRGQPAMRSTAVTAAHGAVRSLSP